MDKGRITQVIALGMYLACGCFFVLSACETLMSWNPVLTPYIFFGIALFLGIGFGTMFPAFNTLFVNLAPHNQRGTATSTYLTSWDVGIGGRVCWAVTSAKSPHWTGPTFSEPA